MATCLKLQIRLQCIRLSSTPDVRHETVQVAVENATLSVLTAVLQDSTRSSAAGILPRHASLVTVGCEALGTSVSLIPRDGNETARGRCDCQHQGGWGLGLRGMVNICEPLINVVIENKPKVLIDPARVDRLGPKWQGVRHRCYPVTYRRHRASGEKAEPNPRGYLHGTW